MPGLRVCLECGFTFAEYRARGLLGCPGCYAHFGAALFADLLQLHPELHRAPAPADEDDPAAAPAREEARAGEREELRARFSEALREERYEEAAALRERLRALEGPAR